MTDLATKFAALVEPVALTFAKAFYGDGFDPFLNPEAFDMAEKATAAVFEAHATEIAEALGEREDAVNQMRVLQESHDWLYREKERLENTLKDIASRAHANLATARGDLKGTE